MDKSSGSGAPPNQGSILKGVCSAALTLIICGLCLFGGAGTLHYRPAWNYLIAFSLWMMIGFLWLVKFHPALYNRRLEAGPNAEQSFVQKIAVMGLFIGMAGMFVLPGIDRRYGLSHLSSTVTFIGLIGSFTGLTLVVPVSLYNEYMAASITVESTQMVITTGPYGIVRHPMYSSCAIWMLFTPIALGSAYSVFIVIPLILLLVLRLTDEEQYLRRHLAGYPEYCVKVPWRIIPFVF
jgi:protein-S-isoprenylcysteine O-methyltransferase Ste14